MQNNVYILIAVFILLFVMLVWISVKFISDNRRRKRERRERREAWQRRMDRTIEK